MSDNSELKKLAEAAVGKSYISGEKFFFSTEATPERVLALIADIEQDEMHLRAFGSVAETAIAERDQLRAEVAGLKTGYEAYEQVVQGLKADIDELVTALNEILRVTPMGTEAFGIAALVLGELGVSKETSHG